MSIIAQYLAYEQAERAKHHNMLLPEDVQAAIDATARLAAVPRETVRDSVRSWACGLQG